MKKRLLIATCLFAVGIQNLTAQDYLDVAGDHARLYVGRVEPQYQLTAWRDNPYYGDNLDVHMGRICYHGVVYDNVRLRYDMLTQNVIVQAPTTNIFCIPEQQFVDWFELDGYRYVHDPSNENRYAAVILDGSKNGVRLYHSMWKEYKGEIPVERKFLKILSNYDQYTIVNADGKSFQVKELSDVVKIFPGQKETLTAFSKENRLKYNDDVRETSLAMLADAVKGAPSQPPRGEELKRHTSLAASLTPNSSAFSTSAKALPSNSQHPTSDTQELIAGIPVIDSDSMTVTKSSGARIYIVPGVKKAKVSIADDHELDEILVVGGRQSTVKSTVMGSEKFKPELLKNIPSAFGEVDIMKIALTLPGVTSVGEASSGINVRGGATDQNLILFNGGTVYNPTHLFGLFTAFNADMVEEVELFKASIPAQYGGRISSVMTVTSKEANMKKFTGAVSLGSFTSKANIEIPILEDHVSLLLSGRTTYSDWILKQLPEKSGYRNGSANFYDVGGVLTVKFNNIHKLKINGYQSCDNFSFTADDKYRYVNRNISGEWRSILSEKLTGNLSLGADHYDYYYDDLSGMYQAARLSFAIDMLWAKLNFRHRLSEMTNLTYGLNVQSYDVMAGKYEPIGESLVQPDKLDNEKALESAVYVDAEHKFSDKFSLSAGMRYSVFNALGPRDVNYYESALLPSLNTLIETKHETGVIKTYHAPEFRFSTRYAFMDNLSVKAGINTMTQNIHKVSNSTIMSPTDIWKLSDYNIKPQHGWQLSLGGYYETLDKQYEFSIEGYLKRMTDYLSYRNSAVLLMNHHLETDVISTIGKAYGVELQVKKPTGKLNGWVSYTFSRTFLRQDDERVISPVNDGEWFPSEYDRPHEIKAVLNYKFTERYSISGNFNYATGRPTTIPAGRYYHDMLGVYLPYYTDRNSYRIPDYMRFDFAFNIEPTHKLTSLLHTSFSIGAYNATSRRNAYNVYFISEGQKPQGYKLSVFGSIIPYISLNIRIN